MAAGTKESHASNPNHRDVATVILLDVKKKLFPASVIRIFVQLQKQSNSKSCRYLKHMAHNSC